MLGQQKYSHDKKVSDHLNPETIMSKIEIEHAKIKMLVSSYRDRTFRDRQLVEGDSRKSKNEVVSQSRSFYQPQHRSRLKRRSFLSNDKPILGRQCWGDEGIHQKKPNQNYFNRQMEISKLAERLTPLSNNIHRQNIHFTPQHFTPTHQSLVGIRNEKEVQPQDRISILRVQSNIDSHIFEGQRPSKSPTISKISQRRVGFKQQKRYEIDFVEVRILASHINTLDHLFPSSSPQAIFSFFQSIYETLRIPKVVEPVIKKYKNCIYYGQKTIQENTLYQGMIWYYKHVFYFGDLSDSKKHGKGIEIHLQKGQPQVWKGTFVNGIKNGYFEVETSEYRYYGKLKDGLFEGQGHLITSSSQYKGGFVEGVKEGHGWERFTNKSEYKGEYFNNKYDGEGQLKAPNYYYKGLFKKGRPDGYGFERTHLFQYLGTFAMGKRQGKGRLKASDGTYVECQFKNGLIAEQDKRQIHSPKQIVMEHYLSKELQALNEENEEGTLENMLKEINNHSELRVSPIGDS